MSKVSAVRWYVVQTQVNGEARAASNLLRQGYEIYLPLYLKRRKHARKLDLVPKPLFPRYLFVAIDMVSQRWHSIQSTYGVSHLVTVGEEPAAAPDDVVTAIRAREDAKGFVQLSARRNFQPGERLRVLAGAFVDSIGLFDGMADRDRVAILMDMLGRKVRVHLGADMVAAA